ncbi:MAG: type II toxin-antitoxin system Phd/YefM family antitoxin [Chloroflexi bacterium]|nr:type II toxin-antitoxin system Phd/YefM family antitoxin [Chloroflexota bacterium]
MKVYTYSEARQQLASVLDAAQQDGAVRIRRRDGRTFVLQLETSKSSPSDVEGVDLGISTSDIVSLVRESRSRYA